MHNTEILTSILSGLSRGLNIANKIIPIYQDSKPLFKNAKNIYNIFKNNDNTLKNDNNIEKKNEIKKENIKYNNSPQFFI